MFLRSRESSDSGVLGDAAILKSTICQDLIWKEMFCSSIVCTVGVEKEGESSSSTPLPARRSVLYILLACPQAAVYKPYPWRNVFFNSVFLVLNNGISKQET